MYVCVCVSRVVVGCVMWVLVPVEVRRGGCIRWS